MARTITTEMQTILDGSTREIHWTCELTFPTAGPLRVATTALSLVKGEFAGDLRNVSEIKQTFENPTDRVAVVIQNVDRVLSQDLAANPAEWREAYAVIGRNYSGSGEEQWIEMFRGIVQSPEGSDLTFRFDVIPEPLAKGSFIAARSLAPLCPFRFKDPATCRYSGSETACNHHLKSKEGCDGLGNSHAFGGTEHRYNPDVSIPGTGNNPGDGSGGPPGGCPRLDQWILIESDGRPAPVLVGHLSARHRLFNPVDGSFHPIASLEVRRDQRIAYLVSESGAECYSSHTHKVLWYREHVTGEVITKFVEGDPLLCWNAGLTDSKVSRLDLDEAIGDVMRIEMESGHIYAAGNDGRRFVVAHNTKDNPFDPDIVI